MVKGPHEVVWTKRAQQHLQQAYDYISQDSPQNAAKVVNTLVAAVEKAAVNPQVYGPDKLKKDNDGSYRAFEKYHYRIAYRYTENTIRVLRVRHTSREPKTY